VKTKRHARRADRPGGTFRGFTLVELLIVMAIMLALMAVMSPTLGRALTLVYQRRCATNMQGAMHGIRMYAQSEWTRNNPGALPSVFTPPTAVTNWGDMETGNPGCLWLAVTGRYPKSIDTTVKQSWVAPKQFLCPEAESRRGFKAGKSDDGQFLTTTYSFSYYSMVPWDATVGEPNATIYLISPSTVILADQNPRCTLGQSTLTTNTKRNSLNHKGEGQNAVRVDASVQWIETPDGLGNDIYAADPNGNDGQGKRAGINDSFLIP
jgi:prepilin-type N-terminal cleavage/methylation domain-containing protein